MSAAPAPPVLSKREIQRISLTNFESRKDDITKQLMKAATDLGFFMIEDTGISQAEVHSPILTSVAYVRMRCSLRPNLFVATEKDCDAIAAGFVTIQATPAD